MRRAGAKKYYISTPKMNTREAFIQLVDDRYMKDPTKKRWATSAELKMEAEKLRLEAAGYAWLRLAPAFWGGIIGSLIGTRDHEDLKKSGKRGGRVFLAGLGGIGFVAGMYLIDRSIAQFWINALETEANSPLRQSYSKDIPYTFTPAEIAYLRGTNFTQRRKRSKRSTRKRRKKRRL